MLSRIPTRAAVAASLLVLAACADDGAGPAALTGTVQGLVVSSSRGIVQPAPLAFVSLGPQSLATSGEVVIVNRATGARVRTPLVDGGFDPLAIGAAAGDELQIELPGGVTVSALALARPPVIVRTDPARRRLSVPLNSRIAVVFSEPLDPRSITTDNVRLLGPAGDEATTLSLRDQGTLVDVAPATGLRPGVAYRLIIGNGITDLSGDRLEQADTVDFTTEVPGGPVQAVRILPDSLRLPVTALSHFVVLVDSGRRLINSFPDPSLTWSSRDESIVRVHAGGAVEGMAIGQAWIDVAWQGFTDSALVIVTSWPPPGPFAVFPGGAVIPVGHETRFWISHPEGTPAPVATWSVSDAAILSVNDTGLVRALAAGTAWVYAQSGADRDSAQVEVYDTAPRQGDLYVIRPDSVLVQAGDRLTLSLIGATMPAPAVTWAVGDAALARMEGSDIVALAVGRTTVTATFPDGSTRTAVVRVVEPGTIGAITIGPAAVTLRVGEQLNLAITYDAVAQSLWSESGQGWRVVGDGSLIMPVRSPGTPFGAPYRFDAVRPGTSTITAFAGPLSATMVVTVIP